MRFEFFNFRYASGSVVQTVNVCFARSRKIEFSDTLSCQYCVNFGRTWIYVISGGEKILRRRWKNNGSLDKYLKPFRVRYIFDPRGSVAKEDFVTQTAVRDLWWRGQGSRTGAFEFLRFLLWLG